MTNFNPLDFNTGLRLKILIADSDSSIRQILKTRLSLQGYTILTANNGKEALTIFNNERPDFIILDVMLSNLDGYKICTELRKVSEVPIILLTALNDVNERVIGLELGADDYLIKPFAIQELEARIRSILRRVYKNRHLSFKTQLVVQMNDLKIDTRQKLVTKNTNEIKLTTVEFSLLSLLLQKAGESITREIIFDTIWGYKPERYNDLRVVDVYISRLRAKLENNVRKPYFILTTRGTGYMFRTVKS